MYTRCLPGRKSCIIVRWSQIVGDSKVESRCYTRIDDRNRRVVLVKLIYKKALRC